MKASRIQSMPWRVVVQVCAVFILLLALAGPCPAAAKASTTEKALEAVNGSAEAVNEGLTTFQKRVSDSRLANRSSDEVAAFVLIGVLVASVSGMFSKMGCSGLGIAGRLVLGLIGAFIGGMVVRVGELDFDWSEMIIGYEELLFSLLGAIAIVALSRLIQRQMKKKKSKS